MITLRLLYRRALLLILLLFAVLTPPAFAEQVHVSGAVLNPGDYQWQEGARLRDAAVAGQVSASAWPLGAALLRQRAIEPQQRLKAGVLFELQTNNIHALAENNLELQQLIKRLDASVREMPVTGRVVAELNPFQLLLQSKNDLLQPGDRLVYPTRPNRIRVLGAVAADCQLSFDAGLKLKDYLHQCPAHPAADRSFVYLIQPNGETQKIGIAHWNQQQAAVAVGAIIYRPISAAVLSPETNELNEDMAKLLATQYQLGGIYSE